MQAINTDITLSETTINIKSLLQTNNQELADGMYDRGYFYRVGRHHHKSDRLFGQWLVSTFVEGIVEDVYITVDSRNKVLKLMQCNELLTRDQFTRLGYTKAAELMIKVVIKDFNEEWLALVEVAHTMNKAQIRERMKQIKSGVSFINPPTPEPEEEDDVEIYVAPETSSILDELDESPF